MHPTRREFLNSVAGLAALSSLAEEVLAQTTPASATGLPARPLGKTGVHVSVLCLGGWHIGAVRDDNEAIRIMHRAIDEGLTFFDNAWEYHNGRSEEIMGRALAMDGKRKKVFLMTKNCERDYAGSMRNLEESLRRLRTDYLDLWQFHEINYDNDPDWLFEKGAIKAALEAKKQGKVRFIGFTGHKDPRIHLKMLHKEFHWDAAQMPINVLDAHYRSFQNEVVPVCLKKGVGVIGMKGLGGGGARSNILSNTELTAEECWRYCLSLPISTQVVGITSMEQLEEAIRIARNFKPMSKQEKERLLARVKEYAGDGRYELFKSTQAFDSGHHRRQHGFAV